MARIDRQKRPLGGAVKRTTPSLAASILVKRKLAVGRVLDFGYGYGFDAETFVWDKYDPYYFPKRPVGPCDTVVCTNGLNALSRNNRAKVFGDIQSLLADAGTPHLGVRCDLPVTDKLGMHHSLQNYVALTLPSIFAATN